jgi:hypothetical protein
MARSSEVKIKYLPRERLSAELSYDYRFSMHNEPLVSGIKKQGNNITRSFKATLKYSFSDYMIFSTRFDYKLAPPSGSRGFLLLQDMSLRFRNVPLSIWLRFCIFGTDDWNSRIYVYENDLPGAFNVPSFSGEGSRSCLMVDWKPAKFVDIRIKYAVSEPVNGTNQGDGSTDLRLQIRFWF